MRSASTRHEQTLRVLNLAGLALQQVHTPEEAFEAASKEMNQLGYRTFVLALSRDRNHLQIERMALAAETQIAVEKLTGLSADSYLIPIELLSGYEAVVEQRQAIFVSDLVPIIANALPVPARVLAKKTAKLLALKQGILAPLLARGEVEGILIVSTDGLSEVDVPAVTAFADQISAALERTRLFAELREREWRATVAYEMAQQYAQELEDKVREEQARLREISALHLVATVTAGEIPAASVMGRVLAGIKDLFHVDNAAIYLLDSGGRLRPASALGLPEPFLSNLKANPPSLSELYVGQTLLTGEPVLIEDLETIDHPIPLATRKLGMRTVANLPLRAGGQLIGVMTLGAANPHALAPDDVPLLNSIATQFAITLENKWLLERERQHLAELDKLNNALRLLASQLRERRDEPAVARLLCEAVCNTLGWKQAIVSLRRSEAMTSRSLDLVGYPQGVAAEQWSTLLSPPGDAPWMKEEFRIGHSYYVPDVAVLLDPGKNQRTTSTGEAKQTPDLLVVPLEAGGRILGVLSPMRYKDKSVPTRQQIEHLELFTAQAAIAIESIRLSKSMRMWADAVRHSADAIVITDVEGSIVSVNPAFEELSGYRQEEVIGQNTRILNSGLTSSETFTEMWNTSLDGGTWRGEVINQRKDGSVYDADLTVAPILDEEDRIIGLIGSHRNITQVKKLDRLKTQFVSNISHELRTPLTNIKLYQRYLREGRRPDLQKRFFDILDRETDRLMQMIESLLDLSRLEAGTMPFDSEPLDVNELVGKVLADYYDQAQERGISLVFEPAENLPGIIAGRHQISQAFTNLLTNALNYTPSGGSVHVATGSSEEAISLSIRDTGHGMTADETEHVFERFYRGEAAQELGIPGTGLGLSIVKQILELHGGTIEVESQIGEGTTVRVTLPAAEVDVKPTKILLVEDDPDIQFLVQHQLEEAGYEVILAGNGVEAIDQLAKEATDLMVLDLQLPKMDGFQVLEHMQTGEYGPAPAVLVITGADPVVASRALTLGATEYLSKPYSPQVFLDVVYRLLQNREQS